MHVTFNNKRTLTESQNQMYTLFIGFVPYCIAISQLYSCLFYEQNYLNGIYLVRVLRIRSSAIEYFIEYSSNSPDNNFIRMYLKILLSGLVVWMVSYNELAFDRDNGLISKMSDNLI